MIDIKDLKVGDVFSEESHYILDEVSKNDCIFTHLESKNKIKLSTEYVSKLLKTANSYTNIVTVGKEDKKDGTLGIRSIFENIHNSQVFTVYFKKQDVAKTKKSIEAEKSAQITLAVESIEKAKKAKKSMATAYVEAIKIVQENPVIEVTPGEGRILIGYKLQFTSRDGRYDCMDMAIREKRPVNINTIEWLVYNGTKYEVK